MSNDNSTCLSNTRVPGMGCTVSRVFTTVLQVGYFSQFTDVETETVSSRLAPLCDMGTKLSVLHLWRGSFRSWGGRGRALCGARTHGSRCCRTARNSKLTKTRGPDCICILGNPEAVGQFPSIKEMKGLFRTLEITAVLSATFCFPHVALHLMSLSVRSRAAPPALPDPSLTGLITKEGGKCLLHGVLVCDA